jgi:putative ABC transport system permease protein
VLLGQVAAETLKKTVGDSMRVGNSAFRVVGIYETGVSWEDVGAVISLRDAQALLHRPRQVSFYSIKLEHPAQAEQVLAQLRADFPELNISKTAELVDSLPDFQTADTLVYSVSLLAALAGGIGMMNTMLMSAFERTREIGTLRALGWRRRRILVLILKESLTLSVIGGIVGIGAGAGLGALMSRAPGLLRALQPALTLSVMLRALGMALLLGSVGGLYPAWWASRLSPAVALRYE